MNTSALWLNSTSLAPTKMATLSHLMAESVKKENNSFVLNVTNEYEVNHIVLEIRKF